MRGTARYVADLRVPDAWVGAALRSPVARGRLLGIDRDGGFDFARVVIVLPGDLPGDNVQALIDDDQPVLCDGEIRHVGEVLALVAAPDRATCEQALLALRPRIEELPAQLDFERSDEVIRTLEITKGDVDTAFATAARVVEGTWRTDSQEQLYIETQGMIAWPPRDGTVVVAGSLQCPYYVQKALARVLALPSERCRVVQCATGGGFGGKEDYPSVLACHAALLARACDRPVRMVYDRHEDLAVTPKRHPSRVRHRTALGADGTIVAMDIDVLLDGGAYATLSPVVLSRGMIHAAGPYRCDHVRIRGRVVRTDHVPFGAFRGFGAPQTCFAIERQMDLVARTLGESPFLLRWRHRLRPGDTTATGQVLDESCASDEVLARAAARTGIHVHATGSLRDTAHSPRRRRGRGMSFFFHGAGFTGSGERHLRATVRVAIDADGRARVATASTEIGQGTHAMFTAIAAEALGARPDDVVLEDADTALVPDSGPTVASRTCMIVGNCIARACRELRTRIDARAIADERAAGAEDTRTTAGATGFRERARAFVLAGGDAAATHTHESPPGSTWDDASYRGDAYPTFGWAVDVCDVEVDLDTFEVEVLDFTSVVDVGKAIQPLLVRGQIEGGSLQAIGFAHREVVSTVGGRFAQDRLQTCIVPTARDAPPMHVELVEKPFAHGPFGAKGVGELPMDGGAPAVVAAIEDALGIAPDRVPATPERLLALWLLAHPEDAR